VGSTVHELYEAQQGHVHLQARCFHHREQRGDARLSWCPFAHLDFSALPDGECLASNGASLQEEQENSTRDRRPPRRGRHGCCCAGGARRLTFGLLPGQPAARIGSVRERTGAKSGTASCARDASKWNHKFHRLSTPREQSPHPTRSCCCSTWSPDPVRCRYVYVLHGARQSSFRTIKLVVHTSLQI